MKRRPFVLNIILMSPFAGLVTHLFRDKKCFVRDFIWQGDDSLDDLNFLLNERSKFEDTSQFLILNNTYRERGDLFEVNQILSENKVIFRYQFKNKYVADLWMAEVNSKKIFSKTKLKKEFNFNFSIEEYYL